MIIHVVRVPVRRYRDRESVRHRPAGGQPLFDRLARVFGIGLKRLDRLQRFRPEVEVFGREIAQILLIHCNELNAMTLRDSIQRIRARGYTFITLAEAMGDEAYQRPDTFAGSGGSWISRSARALGRPLTLGGQPPIPGWILELAKAP